MRNADEATQTKTSLTKIDTGYYRVSVDGQNAGTVEKNEETGEWEANWKGECIGYGRTRAEAVEESEYRHNQRKGWA